MKKKVPAVIPPILLERDDRPEAISTGPGQRYALGPTAPGDHGAALQTSTVLPESYGPPRLWLTARDPHWLYATWDLSNEQQQRYNSLSKDGHLIVRTFVETVGAELASEVHVHPESRHWFIHAGRAGTRYVAELGYSDSNGEWRSVATSLPTLTPPDTESADTSVQFATISPEVTFEKVLEAVATVADEHVPLVEAVQQLRTHGYKDLPVANEMHSRHEWTPAQARALAEVVNMDSIRRVWVGSLEVTELVRRHLEQPVTSPSLPGAGAVPFEEALPGPGGMAISSLVGQPGKVPPGKAFWFSVNAEIVLYGATEPGATVTIGGRPIKLRADGTFSYRFALPDGEFHLPIVATSVDGEDRRLAELNFGRSTRYHGHVGIHPQDQFLQAPSSKAV